MSLAYFCISALDILNQLHDVSPSIEWILAQQVQTRTGRGGFRGGSFAGASFSHSLLSSDDYDVPHIAMTYCALCCLLILGDDLKSININAILKELKSLQLSTGSFRPCAFTQENDLRFLFCACAISYILDDWSGVDTDLALKYIHSSKNYDGGYGQGPYQESHGGSTYCAIASLHLLGQLDLASHSDTIFWLLKRQKSGFQGRVNKPEDTCYSFWIGASLDVIFISSYCRY